MNVAEAITELRNAAERLAADHPELAADERAFLDTLDGVSNGLDLAEWLAERALHLAAMEAAAKERAAALLNRAKRFAADQERLRNVVLALVDAAGGKKVVRASLTLSPRNVAPKVVATDPAATPAEYLNAVTTMVPDRKAIAEALELGATVDGWVKTNGGRSLTILTR